MEISHLLHHINESPNAANDALEQQHRGLLEVLPVPVYTTDAEGRLTYCNPAACAIAGRMPSVGVDRWSVFARIFMPSGNPLPLESGPVAGLLRGDSVPTGMELQAERPDGSRVWFTHSAALLYDSGGKIAGTINVLADISDRKRAEEFAEHNSRLLNAIVDSSTDAIYSNDLDGIVTSWNKSAELLFGFTAEEIIGRPLAAIVPLDRVGDEPRILDLLQKGDRVEHFETIRCRKDGRRLDVSLTISAIRNALGHIDGVVKIARDVAETKRSERNSRLLSAIVDSSEDAIISKDLNGIITSWNKSAERLFGYSENEIVGLPVTTLMPKDRLDEEPLILARIRRGERVDHFETVRRRKDGVLLDISLTISPIKDSNGSIIGASKIARDITEQKRIHAEMKRANQDLEQFAYSVSHDLQEPLRSIKIYSQLLDRRYKDRIDAEGIELLQFLYSGASRMEALVNDLLAYTRVMQSPSSLQVTDANHALEGALTLLGAAIVESGARVSWEALPSLPIHETHLQLLFQNIIGNAIKYRSANRTPVITITAERQAGSCTFAIRDNGIGIDPEFKEKIFGLFKRLHTGDEYAGTGIGLAICQRIAEQYHGRIWVESEPGEGSVFRFTIPGQGRVSRRAD